MTDNINKLQESIYAVYYDEIDNCKASLIYSTLLHQMEILKSVLNETNANDIARDITRMKEEVLLNKSVLINL